MTLQMNDLAAFHTFQMQMLLTAPSRLYILVSRLASLFCYLFDHSAFLRQLIQIAVNGCDIYFTVVFF